MPRHQVRALAAAIALILATPAWAQVCDSGTIVVDGDDTGDRPSPWNAGDRLTIGSDGECHLVIRNGGEVTTPWNRGAMEVGENDGSDGTVTVTGEDSRLWLQVGLRVGIRGKGTLVVEEGGRVELGNDGSLYLGEYGEGTLAIRSGGRVESRGGVLGAYEGSTGTATVSGEGSAWELVSGLSIGGVYSGSARGGTGSLVIEDGGAVTAGGQVAIGSTGGVGSVTVTGAQSVLSGETIFVGNGTDGEGDLVISDGATVTSNRGHVGYPRGTGRVTVTGGATWTLRDMLTLGTQGGRGELLISDGGIVRMAESNYTKSISVGDSDGTGWMEVTGTGSLFSFDGTFYIARSDTSEGDVLVADGGRIESGGVGIGGYYNNSLGQATATVTGSGSTWVSTGGISLRQRGQLTISAGGQVQSPHALIGVGSTDDGVAVATVSGAGSAWTTTTGGFAVGREGAGTLVVADGGTIRAGENGDHTLEIARGSRSVGRVYIGGEDGEAPSEATLDVGRIAFGAGDGMLVFNYSGAGIDIDSAISGDGVIEHRAGRTTFSGVSDQGTRFRGVSRVTGGSLLVDGVFGDETHVMDVSDGATLGGTGTIIGNVTIDDATLAAGASPGTLTIDGNLALGADSRLDFELGAADGAAGVDSDLVVVTGDLVLDGTLDVTDAGGFGEGLYRLFDYGGALADNGLEIGTAPTGFDAGNLAVQTSVANQVNLLVGMPIGLSPFFFWDGSDTTANGGIDGGTGTWTATGSNWTLADGSDNGAFDPTEMLIFAGAPGEVTVDASEGAIVASGGMQFAVDGYTVAGDGLRLDGTAVVRVGDGTEAGAGMTATIAADVSGDAGLAKTDLGTLVLTGSNTYRGGTTIDAGTLEIRSDAALGDAAGSVAMRGTGADGATLAFGAALSSARAFSVAGSGNTLLMEDGTVELSGLFSGTGDITKRGAGLLHFTGDGTGFTGGFTLDEGGMRFDGVLAGSVFTAPGTVLRGIGEIGNLVVGGRLEPGASIGVLTVSGDLTLASGSTYVVELDDAGDVAGVNNDLVSAATATIESGVTLHVTPENGTDTGSTYVPGTVYTIIETAAAGNLVVDAAPTITDDFAFLDFAGETDGWNYYLTSHRIASFCRAGMSFNQCSTANAVEDLGAGHPAFDAALLLGEAEANGAFDALSGEIHASGQLAVERSFALFNRALRHQGVLVVDVGNPGAGTHGAWVAALGGDGRIDGDGNAARMDSWNAGVAAGYERAIDAASGTAVGGFAVGYIRSHAAVDERRSSFDGDGIHLGAYAAWTGGSWTLAGAVSYGTERVSTERRIVFGTVDEAAAADYRARTIGLSGEAAYAFQVGSATRLGPLFTLDTRWSGHDGFSESGAGAFGLASDSQDWKRIDAGIGLALTHAVQGAHGRIALEGRVVWEHAFADEVPQAVNRFGNAAGFEIRGPAIDANRPRIGAGLSWTVSRGVDIRARYDGLFTGDEANHSASVAVHFRF